MQTLDKRISALEQASPTGDMVSTIFLVPLLKEGNAVLESIHDNHGNAWSRGPDETQEAFKDRATSETLSKVAIVPPSAQEAFKDRATSETPRKENQVVMLFGNVAT